MGVLGGVLDDDLPAPPVRVGLAALGTVADVVPLHDENRILVRHGLARLQSSPPLGVRALLESAGLAAGASQASLESQLAGSGSAGGYTTITAASGSAGLTALAGTPTQFDFVGVNFGNDVIAGFD